MPAKGFAHHAARNRARALRFIALYCLAFVPLGLLVLGLYPLLFGQAGHSILVEPLLFSVQFLPLAIALSLALLAHNYYGLRTEIEQALEIRAVTAREEPRFVRIAEEAAILQGLRQPRFGVIEVPARNAMAIGATQAQRMIAVTRGLLEALDDDELAAILAHELAHFRAGDAMLLSLNHALMRTAVQMQTWNPLRVEKNVHMKFQWHFVAMIFVPIILVGLIAGGFVTMMAWKVARLADRGVRSARDYVADAEAVRFTHFPEALETAIARCEGHGYFPGAEKFEAMLFAGNPVSEGGTHPQPANRCAKIREVAHEMYLQGRSRRDTRAAPRTPFATAPRAAFGRRGVEPALVMAAAGSFAQANRRSSEIPREQGLWVLYAWVFDRKAYRDWQLSMFDQYSWREEDKRNIIGGTTEATAWVVGALAISVWFHIAMNPDIRSALEQMSGRAFFATSDRAFGGLYCDSDDPACREKTTFGHTDGQGTWGTGQDR